MEKENRYIDLFAGCGGLSLGLHNAGWKGLFAIEKSPDAFKTLQHNLIEKKKHFDWPKWLPESNLDINSVLRKYSRELKELKGKVDMVVGGPPCQGFSAAGKRKEDDVRNGLIKSYLRFIGYVEPKIIFFENVRGFTHKFEKNKSKGIVYSNYVVKRLKMLGYDVEGRLIDFSKYGVPQKRTRFILVGIKKDFAKDKNININVFFEKLSSGKQVFLQNKGLPQNPTLSSAISDLFKRNGLLDTPDRKNFQSGQYITPRSKYQEFLRKEVNTDIPNSHSFPKHSKKIIKRFKYFLKEQDGNRKISEEIRTSLGITKHTIVPLSALHRAPTITTLPDDYIHYAEPRILTVREFARIQSFPDWYEFQGKYTTGGKLRTSEVPRYTQVGNAIPPLFGEQCGFVLGSLISNE